MLLKTIRMPGLKNELDFRAKATFGVALAALALLFPIAILNFFQGNILTGVGSMGIVTLLATNVWLVHRGRCHQNLTLIVLVPAGMLFMITVFQHDGIIGSLWCFPSIVAVYCMLSERRAWLGNLCILTVSLPMALATLSLTHSIRVCATLIAISLFSAILVRVIDQLNRKLQYQLVHDPLTGLLNRMTLKSRLELAIRQYRDTGLGASLLAIDVDHFKTINDRFGHDAGDAALVGLASTFRDILRVDDHAFRTGGEEFLVLLSASDEMQANIVAERLRRHVEVATIIPDTALTVSIGVAQYAINENWTQWIKRADNLLYEAKRLGRNRVAVARKAPVVSIGKTASSNAAATHESTGTNT